MLIEIFSWPFSFQKCVPDVRMESTTGLYQADARPTKLPRPAKKFKSRRLVHAAERSALPRSMSSFRYSLEAIFKSLTQTAFRCTESCIIIQQSSWSDWNTILRSFKLLNNLMSKGWPPWAKNKQTNKQNLQNLRFWSCRSSLIAIELTFSPQP